MKKASGIAILLIVVLGIGFGWHHHTTNSAPKTTAKSSSQPANTARPIADKTAGFDKQQYSIDDPTSIWVVVNKTRPLSPISYAPSDLVVPTIPLRVPGDSSMYVRQVTATALETMFAAAKQDDINLMLSSGYRSYSFQVSLYGSYVKSGGQAAADAKSARPGFSEHQTGLAADIEPLSQKCNVDQCFGNLPEGKWLAANAWKYGFIIRYQADIVNITGYEAEPWHVRYVGVALSTEMHKTGIRTLEQFFGLPNAPDYPK